MWLCLNIAFAVYAGLFQYHFVFSWFSLTFSYFLSVFPYSVGAKPHFAPPEQTLEQVRDNLVRQIAYAKSQGVVFRDKG